MYIVNYKKDTYSFTLEKLEDTVNMVKKTKSYKAFQIYVIFKKQKNRSI